MSKQTGLHPDERQDAPRASKKRQRHRPWHLIIRAAYWPRKGRKDGWWTAGRYETEELARQNLAKCEREYPEALEKTVINVDLPRAPNC
jgi:hypothetical protein